MTHFQIEIQGRETKGITKFKAMMSLLETKVHWTDVCQAGD